MEPPEKVVACFTRLTGIEFRIPPHAVMRQAALFAKQFALEELEITVLWIKRQISLRKSGFTEASYSWKRLFGEHGSADEFQTFQERLSLANTERKRGWKPKFHDEKSITLDDTPEGFDEWCKTAYPGKSWALVKAHLRSDLLREFRAFQQTKP